MSEMWTLKTGEPISPRDFNRAYTRLHIARASSAVPVVFAVGEEPVEVGWQDLLDALCTMIDDPSAELEPWIVERLRQLGLTVGGSTESVPAPHVGALVRAALVERPDGSVRLALDPPANLVEAP